MMTMLALVMVVVMTILKISWTKVVSKRAIAASGFVFLATKELIATRFAMQMSNAMMVRMKTHRYASRGILIRQLHRLQQLHQQRYKR